MTAADIAHQPVIIEAALNGATPPRTQPERPAHF